MRERGGRRKRVRERGGREGGERGEREGERETHTSYPKYPQ